MTSDSDRRVPAGRRREVLGVLREASRPLSIAEIAQRLDVHPNTVRFHLDTLVGAGRVERVGAAQRGPGRPPLLFRAVAGMDPAGPRHYRLLTEILADTLAADPDPAARAAEAGRAWGRRHDMASGQGEPVGRLVGLLDELGFAPERDTGDGDRIDLRNCPFLEFAAHRPQIACPIHLGLMQGSMEAWRSPVTVDRLEPFVEPDRCVAHLGSVSKS